jgi:hypothetical protein
MRKGWVAAVSHFLVQQAVAHTCLRLEGCERQGVLSVMFEVDDVI